MARDKKQGKSPVAEETRCLISINQGRKPIQLRYCGPRAAIYFKPACVLPGLRPADFREARTMDSGFPLNDSGSVREAQVMLTSVSSFNRASLSSPRFTVAISGCRWCGSSSFPQSG